MQNLRYDKKTMRNVLIYSARLSEPLPCGRYEIKKLLKAVPMPLFENLLVTKKAAGTASAADVKAVLEEAHDIMQKDECLTLDRLAVNGDDLIKAGIPRGEAMGEALEALLDAVMRSPGLNEKTRLLEYLSLIGSGSKCKSY